MLARTAAGYWGHHLHHLHVMQGVGAGAYAEQDRLADVRLHASAGAGFAEEWAPALPATAADHARMPRQCAKWLGPSPLQAARCACASVLRVS